jgi:hypothetical protein
VSRRRATRWVALLASRHGGPLAGIALLSIGLCARPAFAEGPGERRANFQSGAEVAAQAAVPGFDTADPARVQGAPGTRSFVLPYRVSDTSLPPGSAGSAAPLYGVLAGRALLSAFHAQGALPGGATPWVDGDAHRMIAGFEFSF